jgi:hypothetical protein
MGHKNALNGLIWLLFGPRSVLWASFCMDEALPRDKSPLMDLTLIA